MDFNNTTGYEIYFGNDTNDTYGNSSGQCHYENYGSASVLVVGWILGLVILFGLCASLVNIRVFTHPHMRKSTVNWYLTVLSVADFLTLISSFFMLVLPRLGEYYENYQAIRLSYNSVPYAAYGLAATAHTTTIYMMVLMSAHRFIGVCFPFKAATILTRTRVKIAIISVVTFVLLFNVTRFFEVTISGECFSPNINETMVMMDATELRNSALYQTLMYGWSHSIFMFLLPFTALIIMNSKVILEVHRSRKRHERMSVGDDGGSKKQEQAKEVSTSIMLIGIVVVFVVCNFLGLVCNFVEVLGLNRQISNFSRMVEINNLLVNTNASINIFVYLLFSEKYRLLFRYYLCFEWTREGEPLLTAV